LVVVEGAGGLFSPVSRRTLSVDLAARFGYPLVLVVANRLGVISDTLQTLLAARAYPTGPLPVAAVVLCDVAPRKRENDESCHTNFADLQHWVRSTALSRLTWQATRFEPPIDWFGRSNGRFDCLSENLVTDWAVRTVKGSWNRR
jgi:dethiobiotin synthetase